MDEDLDYYLKYVKPAEFGSDYYKNSKYFDSDTNQYVAYKDSEGFLTFGPGVLVDDSLLKKLGKKKIKEGDKVDQTLIDAESESRWRQAVKEAKNIRGRTPSRLPVAEMIYQMGLPSVLQFKETLAQTDPESAKQKALKSDWAKQTPERAEAVTDRLKEAMELQQPEPKEKPVFETASTESKLRPQLASDIVKTEEIISESPRSTSEGLQQLLDMASPKRLKVDEPYETYERMRPYFEIVEEKPQKESSNTLDIFNAVKEMLR